MRYSKSTESIELYSLFKEALFKTLKEDEDLFALDRYRKESISNRLAISFEKVLEKPYHADILVKGSDILIWDRKDEILLSVFWSKNYLGKDIKEKARAFHIENNSILTLAFSLIPSTQYILIYRFEKLFLDYMHLSYDGKEETVLKRILLDEDGKKEKSLFAREKRKS